MAVSALVTKPSFALILNAGDTVGAVSGADPVPGSTLVDSLVTPMAAGTFTGSLTTSVLINGPVNPFGPGSLTFVYQFSNSGPNSLSRFTISNFAGFGVDAYYVSGPHVDPALMDRSEGDDVVGFSFVGPPFGSGKVVAGKASDVLVIHTNATDYQPTFAAVIDGTTAEPASFAPNLIVPEPSSLALAGTALVGAALWAKRKRCR